MQLRTTLNKMIGVPPRFPHPIRQGYHLVGRREWTPRAWLRTPRSGGSTHKAAVLRVQKYLHIVLGRGESRAVARDVYLPSATRYGALLPLARRQVSLWSERTGAWCPCRLVPWVALLPDISRPSDGMHFRGMVARLDVDNSRRRAQLEFHVWAHAILMVNRTVTSPAERGIGFACSYGRSLHRGGIEAKRCLGARCHGRPPYLARGYSSIQNSLRWKAVLPILKGGLTTYDSGQLHVVELGTGHREPFLGDLAISGQVGRAYDVSRDGRQVVAAAHDRGGKPRLWLRALDRQSPARQIPNVEGDSPLFGQGAEIFFRKIEGASAYAYRVLDDGTGLRKLSEHTISLPLGVSHDGRWVIVNAQAAGGVVALPVQGGLPVKILSTPGSYHLAWSPDGTSSSRPSSARLRVVGRPQSLAPGRCSLLPAGGSVRSGGSQATGLSGRRSFDATRSPAECTPSPRDGGSGTYTGFPVSTPRPHDGCNRRGVRATAGALAA